MRRPGFCGVMKSHGVIAGTRPSTSGCQGGCLAGGKDVAGWESRLSFEVCCLRWHGSSSGPPDDRPLARLKACMSHRAVTPALVAKTATAASSSRAELARLATISVTIQQESALTPFTLLHFEGSRPEWCISSMIYSRDIHSGRSAPTASLSLSLSLSLSFSLSLSHPLPPSFPSPQLPPSLSLSFLLGKETQILTG